MGGLHEHLLLFVLSANLGVSDAFCPRLPSLLVPVRTYPALSKIASVTPESSPQPDSERIQKRIDDRTGSPQTLDATPSFLNGDNGRKLETTGKTGLEDVMSIMGLRFERWKGEGGGEETEQEVGQGGETKQVLLYLPGVEGLGTSIEPQLPSLSRRFDVFRMLVPAKDRSTFLTLIRATERFLGAVQGKTVVVGESFGAVLGLRLGQLRPELVQAIYAVNPASSYLRTSWRALGPLLTLVPPSQYKVATVAVFATTIPDPSQAIEVMGTLLNPNNGIQPLERPRALARRLSDLWSMVMDISDNLPPATLRWRLQNWIVAGADRIERGLKNMDVPVTVVAGSVDRLLPSMEEAARLEGLIPGCRKIVLEGHGHAPFFDGRANLADLIAEDPAMEGALKGGRGGGASGMMTGSFVKDWVGDFVYPDETAVEEGRKSIDFLIKSLSPVFVSTSAEGLSLAGLEGVPKSDPDRPIIFVGNHQLMALDLGLVVERLLMERGVLARGLAHPMLFAGANMTTPSSSDSSNGVDNRDDGMRNTFTKFGAVPVTPRNMYRMLTRKDNVLLFPGGVSEAYHKKGEEYKLFWPEKPEFVRMAIQAGALIIPFSAVGMADSLEMLLDGDEVLRLPIIGERLKKRMQAIPNVRQGGSNKQQFVSPVVVPKLPARQYFRFGQPISTEGLDRRDRGVCQRLYEEVKGEVELGIEALLEARKSDPYTSPSRRLIYEAVSGGAAPTFTPTEMDAAVQKVAKRQGRLITRRTTNGSARREGTGAGWGYSQNEIGVDVIAVVEEGSERAGDLTAKGAR